MTLDERGLQDNGLIACIACLVVTSSTATSFFYMSVNNANPEQVILCDTTASAAYANLLTTLAATLIISKQLHREHPMQ